MPNFLEVLKARVQEREQTEEVRGEVLPHWISHEEAEIQRLRIKVQKLQIALQVARSTIIEMANGPGVRNTDPGTSAESAEEAVRDNAVSAAWVRRVMEDGRERNDEEIHDITLGLGYRGSLSRIQHGRRALLLAGVLVLTGRTKLTRVGRKPSRTYVLGDTSIEERETL